MNANHECGYLVNEFPITFHNDPWAACILPEGHDGEHLCRDARGGFWAWEKDWGCDCDEGGCDCIIFGPVGPETVQALMEAARASPLPQADQRFLQTRDRGERI